MNENRMDAIEMLRAVAHQWRQPLNLISMEAINLTVQANIESEVSSKDVLKSADIISQQTQRMSNVLKSILNIGKGQRAKELFSINKLLESIEMVFAAQLEAQNIALHVRYLQEDNQIHGYFLDLQEVIANLVSNAKEAYSVNENFKNPIITIHVDVTQERYIFIIKDEAGGIPAAVIEKIFESNFSTKTKGESFGIGLYIAKIIIEHEFGGTIELISNSLGAKFIVTIPRNDLSNLTFIK